MTRTIFSLSLATLLAVPLFGQDPPKQDGNRKTSPEELKRRKDEAFKDAEAALKKIKGWTAKVRVSFSNPSADSTTFREGSVALKAVDEKTRWLYWEEGFNKPNTSGQQEFEVTSRSLYKGFEFLLTDEKARVVEKYDFTKIDFYFPQMFTRDGFSREIETNFSVDIVANARYMKTESEATAEDWKFLGFKSKEEFDDFMKNKKATGSSNTPTDKSEVRPFKDEEDKFDKANPLNVLPGVDEAKWKKYYCVNLVPTSELLKMEIKMVRVMLMPETFLPISIMIEKKDDSHISANFTDHAIDPKPELEDKKFQLATDGFKVKEPQKED